MSFYCEKHIKKGRKVKTCTMCGSKIDGTPHYTIPYMEDLGCSSANLCHDCYDDCEKKAIDKVEDIPNYMD